jgi:hypothetical protein
MSSAHKGFGQPGAGGQPAAGGESGAGGGHGGKGRRRGLGRGPWSRGVAALVWGCALFGLAAASANGGYGSAASAGSARSGGSAGSGGGGGREPQRDKSGSHEGVERFTAFAVDLGAPAAARRSSIVQITIDRWSTDEERKKLVASLLEGGESKLLDALQSSPTVGTIRTPDSVASYLHYAHQTVAADGSRHVFIATDRLIRFWESYFQTRSVHYPFMLIELQLDKNGRGEGRILSASKITARPELRRIEIETYSAEPVLLENVRSEVKGG